ncbi:hypothetical protein ACEWY4_022185 [Coilia grayii]|uniref:Cytospin-A n=1 Tax=Coilia grayii TaxID=363190 RepID=A0ABD1J5A1_9TELE
MGNLAGKDGLGPSGSHFDFFQTPPSSPSAPDFTGMPLPSTSSSSPLPSPTETASDGVAPVTASPISPTQRAEDVLMAEAESELSRGRRGTNSPSGVDSVSPVAWSEERRSQGAAPGCVTPGGHLQEVVTGGDVAVGGGALEGVVTEGVATALLQLLEQHRGVLGLCTGQGGVAEVLGVIKKLLMEREEFIEDVQSLKQTLESERTEWLQFQSDLQVAVAVADRLRAEAEESARALRFNQQEAAECLEATQARLRQAESNTESLRALYAEACQRLEQEQLKARTRPPQLDQSTQTRAEEQLKARSRPSQLDQSTQTRAERLEQEQLKPRSRSPQLDQSTKTRAEIESTEGRVSDIPVRDSGSMATSRREKAEEVGDGRTRDRKSTDEREPRKPAEELSDSGEVRVFGTGVTDYERRTLPGFGLRDPRKIVMLSERSRSLSRLPFPSNSPPGQSGVSQTPLDVLGATTQSQDTGREATGGRGRRLDRLVQRQDSWSSFYTSKQDDDQSTDVSSVIISKVRPEDSFSMLLRRHGGSRRNSLLRWCQRRTQGYKNIDITNFSTSWEDGLAFCAVYHTYLPMHIPYSTLHPENKKENLDLAFRTGESVGITATLTVEEILSTGGPDWQRVLEYVESMFRHFEM